MSQEDVELVRRAFSVVDVPGDPETMVAHSDPGFEMHLVGVGGEPVHYAGEAGIREFFNDVELNWESFRFEATEIRDLKGRVLVLGDVRGRGRLSGAEVDARWGWIVAVEGGKAVSLRGFLDQQEALEAAGLEE